MGLKKTFKWVDFLILAIIILVLVITGYRAHKNELVPNATDILWLLAILFVFMIARTIHRIFGLGSIKNMLIGGVVIIAISYLSHISTFQNLLFLALLPVVIVVYGLFKLFKWIRDRRND